ncbi:MAG: hypothetical protein AVDCRST_MAG76-3817, partial [uncultured Acidimicrobiales bacterium]
ASCLRAGEGGRTTAGPRRRSRRHRLQLPPPDRPEGSAPNGPDGPQHGQPGGGPHGRRLRPLPAQSALVQDVLGPVRARGRPFGRGCLPAPPGHGGCRRRRRDTASLGLDQPPPGRAGQPPPPHRRRV